MGAGAEALSLMKQNETITQHEGNLDKTLEDKINVELAKQAACYEQKIQELEAKLERFCKVVENRNTPERENHGRHVLQDRERNEQSGQRIPRFQDRDRLAQRQRENERVGYPEYHEEDRLAPWQRSAPAYGVEYERDGVQDQEDQRADFPYSPGYGRPIRPDNHHRGEFARLDNRQRPFRRHEDAGNIPEEVGRDNRADYRTSQGRSANRYARSDDGSRSNQRNIEAEIINADRRMEKWHLTFSGDNRQRSLEDFLHKVRRLARMDRISDGILLQRIHTILRGEAYDWYLCYADELLDWEDFEERIRYMYGNPNKDQGNRQKIYERKQQRNESFLTFKMEVERLNKLLSSPLDQSRLFEIIWDNMRPHYRSRLACRTVKDLRMLEYYAYRIDANDPTFRAHREGHNKSASNLHNIEADNEQSDAESLYSDSEEVHAMDKKFNRDRRPRDDRRQSDRRTPEAQNHQSTVQEPPRDATRMLCWNYGKTGHTWRYCREEKRIFCYVCGTPGKTSVNCPNHPRSYAQVNSGN